MSLLDVAASYYRMQAAIARAAQTAVQRQWRTIQPTDLDGSWAGLADRLLVTVAAAQMLAAQQADPYLDEALAEQDEDPDSEALVAAQAFAGVASDGRPLDTLLYLAVIRVKQAFTRSLPPTQAMARGEAALLQLVGSQVQDAGRAATSVAITTRPQVEGWTRMVSSPACSRCVILAGKVFRWNEGFRRHHGCRCVHIPSVEDDPDDLRTDPKAYFNSLSTSDQDRYFGVADAQRIRAGADMNRVVNAHRKAAGLSRPGAERPPGARVMPEAIADTAGDDRAERLRLLERHGFIAT